MFPQFQMQANNRRRPTTASLFAMRGLLQRKCACGGAPEVSGECIECRENGLQRNAIEAPESISSGMARLGHDFGSVQIHSRNVPDDAHEFFMNGPDETSKPAPPAAPAKKQPAAPAKAASNCPNDIRVAVVSPANDADFGKDGFLNGWGGIAIMEVSDPSGKTWDGTAIHENLQNIKNTCGERGKKICSNVSGEHGTAGSTFKVGAESNFLGKVKLPAAKNRFYDLHVFSTKEASLLHEIKKDACEVQCAQTYDCGGKKFGPEFVVTYAMTRDVVKDGKKDINVTRVGITKAAKATDSNTANP